MGAIITGHVLLQKLVCAPMVGRDMIVPFLSANKNVYTGVIVPIQTYVLAKRAGVGSIVQSLYVHRSVIMGVYVLHQILANVNVGKILGGMAELKVAFHYTKMRMVIRN